MSPLVLPLVPLAAAGVLVALRARPRLLGPVAVAALLSTFLLGVLAAATEPAARLAWSPAIELTLAVSGFGRVMVVLVPLVATPIVAYAAATEPEGRTRLLALLLVFVSAMLLLVVAGDFVTLLLGWELVGATSWALIGHGWRDRANTEAGTQAFLTTRLGDLGLYVAAGATLAATGSFAFDGVGVAASPWREIIAGGVVLAAVAKSAQVPFSPWLFAAMAGPTPVSALLHSATLVAAGAYLLIRLSPALSAVWWFLPVIAIVGVRDGCGRGRGRPCADARQAPPRCLDLGAIRPDVHRGGRGIHRRRRRAAGHARRLQVAALPGRRHRDPCRRHGRSPGHAARSPPSRCRRCSQ